MIETGFRMVENERVRTRSRSVTVRTLCFLYSLVLFNAWVLANAELTGNPLALGGVYSRFTQTDMKVICLEILPWGMDGGRPPPDPHCPCCTGATCRASAPLRHFRGVVGSNGGRPRIQGHEPEQVLRRRCPAWSPNFSQHGNVCIFGQDLAHAPAAGSQCAACAVSSWIHSPGARTGARGTGRPARLAPPGSRDSCLGEMPDLAQYVRPAPLDAVSACTGSIRRTRSFQRHSGITSLRTSPPLLGRITNSVFPVVRIEEYPHPDELAVEGQPMSRPHAARGQAVCRSRPFAWPERPDRACHALGRPGKVA